MRKIWMVSDMWIIRISKSLDSRLSSNWFLALHSSLFFDPDILFLFALSCLSLSFVRSYAAWSLYSRGEMMTCFSGWTESRVLGRFGRPSSHSPPSEKWPCVQQKVLCFILTLFSMTSVGEFWVRILLNKHDCLAIPPIKIHFRVFKNFGGWTLILKGQNSHCCLPLAVAFRYYSL